MIIGLTGATGFIGQNVILHAMRRGHEVIAFSRNASRQIHNCIEVRPFNLRTPPNLEHCEAVIHLAAESVIGFWSRKKMQRIAGSRIQGTRSIVEAIASQKCPPEVFISASAVGFYGDAGETELTEDSPNGRGFLPETCQAWEKEACHAENICRVATPRIGLVLGKDGGALRIMTPLFRWGLGGILGNGRQWMPWIHMDDLASLLIFSVENMDIRGAINAVGPRPVRNKEFTQTFAQTLRRPAVFRAPTFGLKALLGEFSHELLDSKRVVPAKALEQCFPFSYPDLREALRDIVL